MKICFLTEMGFRGKTPSNHANMRTEFAWFFALDADHFNVEEYKQVSGYDWVMLILPKGGVSLNSEGIRLNNNSNRFAHLYSLPFVETLKKNNKKVAYVQEGPSWYVNDFSLPDQFNFFNQLAECDVIFAHNEYDTHWYSGWFPSKPVTTMPTLMIEDLIKNITPVSEDKAMIGGAMCRWYGGFQSYLVASEFNCPIYTTTSHCTQPGEDQVPNLTLLPRMMWVDWMKCLSSFRYAVNMMPTVAAGTFSLNCLSEDTEVLTKNGIKKITDCDIGDIVLSLNKNNGKVEYKHIINKILRDKHYNEKIYHVNGRSVDFIATEDHNFVIQNLHTNEIREIKTKELAKKYKFKFPSSEPIDGNKSEFINLVDLMKNDEFVVIYISFKEFKKIIKDTINLDLTYRNMLDMTRRDIDYSLKRDPFVRLSVGFIRKYKINLNDFGMYTILVERFLNEYANEIPYKIEVKNFFKLMGLYISEGYVNKDAYRISICQSKQRIRGESRYNLIANELSWIKNKSFNTNAIEFSSPILNRILSDLCGSGALNKHLPEWVFSYDHSLLIHLFEGLMLGDGNVNGNCYYTSSDKLKSDFCKLCIHLGYGITIGSNGKKGEELRGGFVHNNDAHIIHIRKKCSGSFLRNKEFKDITSEIKKVVCIEVEDNHTFLGGRKGKFQWIGNCAYFGIPCIGNTKVDTQRKCFPDLSVDAEDVIAARNLAKGLKENDAFYKHVSDTAKQNYKKYYNLDIWKETMYKKLIEYES